MSREVALDVVFSFEKMFDLSLSKDKMMDMMPGLLLFLARRPEMVEPAMQRMLPMMKDMHIEVNDDLMVEMMPSVAKAVNREPGLGGKIFARMVPMMKAFGLKMNLYIMKRVMGLMMAMMFKHPRVIPGMMMAMPKML
jgi:hypothetical protein